jgi:hypothetical protein
MIRIQKIQCVKKAKGFLDPRNPWHSSMEGGQCSSDGKRTTMTVTQTYRGRTKNQRCRHSMSDDYTRGLGRKRATLKEDEDLALHLP